MKLIKTTIILCFIAALLGASGCSTDFSTMKRGKFSRSAKVDSTTDREFKKALSYMKAGKNEDAERVLLTLTQSHPKLTGPYANLGIVYYNMDRLDDAEKAFNTVLELNAKNPVAYNYLGVIRRSNGEFEKARQAYEKALKVDPTYASAELNLGILYDLYLNQLDKALTHYQQYQEMTGGNDKQVAIWITEVQKRGGFIAKKGKEVKQ